MDTLSSNEQLGSFLKPVRVTEGNLGERSASARIVDDVLLERRCALEQETAFVTSPAEIQELEKLEMAATEIILTRIPLSQRGILASTGVNELKIHVFTNGASSICSTEQ